MILFQNVKVILKKDIFILENKFIITAVRVVLITIAITFFSIDKKFGYGIIKLVTNYSIAQSLCSVYIITPG